MTEKKSIKNQNKIKENKDKIISLVAGIAIFFGVRMAMVNYTKGNFVKSDEAMIAIIPGLMGMTGGFATLSIAAWYQEKEYIKKREEIYIEVINSSTPLEKPKEYQVFNEVSYSDDFTGKFNTSYITGLYKDKEDIIKKLKDDFENLQPDRRDEYIDIYKTHIKLQDNAEDRANFQQRLIAMGIEQKNQEEFMQLLETILLSREEFLDRS
jgi:hypothetical protein